MIPEVVAQFNDHNNDIGDWCPWSEELVTLPESEWDDACCPARCRNSAVEERS